MHYVLEQIEAGVVYKAKEDEDISFVLVKELSKRLGDKVEIWRNTQMILFMIM